MIAGRITPNIITTASTITGCVAIEIIKLVQGHGSHYNAAINLGTSTLFFSDPIPLKKITTTDCDPLYFGKVKAIPESQTAYDKVVVEGPLSFEAFFAKMKADFNVDVTMVTSGNIIIYSAYLPGNKHASRRPRKIEDIYYELAEDPLPRDRTYLALEIGGEVIGEGCDFQMPTIKYFFKPHQSAH